MEIHFTIPNDVAQRLADAIPIVFHYKEKKDGPPLPFFKQKTIQYWKGILKAAEGQAAGEAARKAKNDEIDQIGIEVD